MMFPLHLEMPFSKKIVPIFYGKYSYKKDIIPIAYIRFLIVTTLKKRVNKGKKTKENPSNFI